LIHVREYKTVYGLKFGYEFIVNYFYYLRQRKYEFKYRSKYTYKYKYLNSTTAYYILARLRTGVRKKALGTLERESVSSVGDKS